MVRIQRTYIISLFCLGIFCSSAFCSLVRQQGASTRRTGIIISEILCHPVDPNAQFIELFNTEPVTNDLSGYRLEGSISFQFPKNTFIPGRQYLVIAKMQSAVYKHSPAHTILGPYAGSLTGATGRVTLIHAAGAELLEIMYSSEAPWPLSAFGAGHSLVLDKPDHGEASWKAWSAGDRIGGTPGYADSNLVDSLSGIMLNEVRAGTNDFIELYNHSDAPVDISSCILSNSRSRSCLTLSPGTPLSSGSLFYVDSSSFPTGFTLGYSGNLYLLSPNNDRVIDAVRYGSLTPERSSGRYPDGNECWHELSDASPDAPNEFPYIHDVVINEIMFHPISENSDHEYIELYNRGATNISLSGWRLSGGIRYDFKDTENIPANGYCVIARNKDILISRYPQLNELNTYGSCSGKLDNRSEKVILEKQLKHTGVSNQYGIVDSVLYTDGWGNWADGGGSSLELIDAHADNSLAANWQGSDESHKAPWTDIQMTGKLELGAQTPNELQILLLNDGECLLDDISVIRSGQTVNRISNGGFESDFSGWVKRGTHLPSTIDDEAYSGNKSLHITATGGGNTGANNIETDLTSALANGNTATISAKARWLAGHRHLLLRIYGNYLELLGTLDVPDDLGSPGLPNSRAVVNAGPVIEQVKHTPALPAHNESVTVSAHITDPDGLSAQLHYRIDPSALFTDSAMHDDGTGGDTIAGDGIFSAVIPAQVSNTVAAFYITAEDQQAVSAASIFPAAAPEKECLVRFGDARYPGAFGCFTFWMSQKNVDDWVSRQKLDNDLIDTTIVYDDYRIVYNAGIRMRGSSYIRVRYDHPITYLCSYGFKVPKFDRLFGASSFFLDSLEQDDVFWHTVRDPSFMRERLVYTTAEKLEIPFEYQRFLHVTLNGVRKGEIYADTQHPNDDFVDSWYPDDNDGGLYEIASWHEYNDEADGHVFSGKGTLEKFTGSDGFFKRERYRWCFRRKPFSSMDDDCTNLFELIDAFNIYPPDVRAINAVADVREWLRSFAVVHVVGDWDSYAYDSGKNGYMYKPPNGKWQQIIWDKDYSFNKSSTNANLFTVSDPVLANTLFAEPEFVRIYWQSILECMELMYSPDIFNTLVDEWTAAFQTNGVNSTGGDALKKWLVDRRINVFGQMAAVDAAFEIITNNGGDFSTPASFVSIQGTTPLQVYSIRVNGTVYPVAWDAVNQWQISVPLVAGANQFEFQGYDRADQELPGMVDSIIVTCTGDGADPAPQIVINEIMYHPVVGDAEFVELYNASPYFAFNLAGCSMGGIDVAFYSNAVLNSLEYAVIVKDKTLFTEEYGTQPLILGEYLGKLSNSGEELVLYSSIDEILDTVNYSDAVPWPVTADGQGPSLQLKDALRDNRRPANWAASNSAPYTPGRANSVFEVVWPFPELWLNEVQTDNSNTVTDGNGDYDPWVELVCFSPVSMAVTETTIIPAYSTWRYLDNGSDQGTAWREPGFDDTSWKSGQAELGYGDSPNTVVSYGPDSNNKYATTYFRKEFTVNNPSQYSAITIGLLRDDGAIVYLNGKDIRRDNMPAGEVGYDQYASGSVSGDAENQFFLSSIDPADFIEGNNTIAVEIHQIGPDSSDISFNMYITGMFEAPSPRLAEYYLTDDLNDLKKWAFPTDTEILSNGFLVVWLDTDAGASTADEPHANFTPASVSNSIALTRVIDGKPVIIDYMNYPAVFADRSYGSYPDGYTLLRRQFSTPTPGSPNSGATVIQSVVINEWMADNDTVIPDPADSQYEDWFELYNPEPYPVNLTGWTLSDGATEWTIPSGMEIGANGFLLIWADGEPEQNGQYIHTGFKLSKAGESIHLYSAEQILIDSISFGTQSTDISEGRLPDGTKNISILPVPTPGQSNTIPEPAALLVYVTLLLLLQLRISKNPCILS